MSQTLKSRKIIHYCLSTRSDPIPGLSDHPLTAISNCSHKYFTQWDYATWFIDADCVVRHDVVAVDNDNGDNGHNAVTSDFRSSFTATKLGPKTWRDQRADLSSSRQPRGHVRRILCHLCENVKIYPLLSIAFWWMDARWGVLFVDIVVLACHTGVQRCRTSNKTSLQR